MKILYLITRAERGGAQVHVLDLIANLPKHYQPVLATGEDGFLCDECAKIGVPVVRIPNLIQPISPVRDVRALAATIRLIRSEKPALVHAHTSKAGLLARLAGRVTQTPVVFTAHTWSFADGIPSFRRRIVLPLERLAAASGGKIISVSRANTEMALRQSVCNPKNLVTIWNGVRDVAFRARPGTGSPLTLVMTARFADQKDHMLLVEAMSSIPGDWRLLLVGDGPTRAKVSQAVDRAGLSAKISFLGDRSDIPEMLASSDAFVLATKWEGLPLSILEAMRAGLPVIASDIGGVAEAVTDQETGFLVPPGDVSQLRSRIQTLIASPDLMRTMGYAGRVRYERDFRMETMIYRTLTVYDEAVSGKVAALPVDDVKSLEVRS